MKYCNSILLLMLLVLPYLVQSQLVLNSTELHFHSNFEAITFGQESSSDQQSDLAFLLAGTVANNKDSLEKIIQVLTPFFESLESKKIRGKRIAKTGKIIYKAVKNRFLKNYQPYSCLENIFIDGTYNCVTGTALYALTYQYFDIPYSIQLEPNHVYLIVDPDNQKIIVESTDPKSGYKPFTEDMKMAYLLNLQKAGLMDNYKIQPDSLETVFQRYYFSKHSSINIRELAAIQYFNNSMKALDVNDFEAALHLIEKSEYLFSQPRNEYIYLACLTKLVGQMDGKKEASLRALFKLYDYQGNNFIRQEILIQFRQLAEEILIKNNDDVAFENQYCFFQDVIKEETLLKSIDQLYYQYQAHAAMLSFRYEEALSYMTCAYEAEPNNLEIQRNIADIYIEQMAALNMSVEEKNDFLAFDQFPFLRDFPMLDQLPSKNNHHVIALFQNQIKQERRSNLGAWLKRDLQFRPGQRILDRKLGLFEEME